MRTFCFIILFLGSFNIYSQSVNYDNIIIPDRIYTEDFSEKLVRLAWKNYPTNEIVQREITISEKELTQAKWSWFDNISAQGNLNEFTMNPGENDRAIFYPRYNFSARVTVGMFATIPAEVKKKREEVSIAKARLDQQKLDIRAEVLRRYQEYLMYEKLLETNIKNFEDAFSAYSLAEQRFKNGEISLDDYNTHLQKYNAEQVLRIQAETRLNLATIDLEQLIGVKLSEVQ